RSHHRLKTHARGWRFVMDADGTLHVTTPSGVTRSTRPPGLDRRPPDPPAAATTPPSADPADDPPPF
ncbi:HNH endonuclease, partial [Geodermatophilus sp. CPCC 205506]